MAGSVTSVTQIGYGIGLFLLVCLADLIEHRRLVLIQLLCTAVALLAVGLSRTANLYYIAAFLVGLFTTGAQVLLPFIAQLVPQARRGRVVGTVMAGLLTGLMLARPVALFISASLGWRAVFVIASGVMLLLSAILALIMPRHQPPGGMRYGRLLLTSLHVLRDMPQVRRRALYQTLMFGAFSLFWTAAPLALAARFGLHERGIAVFALAGAGGALVAPWAGHLADAGWTRACTIGAMTVLGLSFLVSGWLVATGGARGLRGACRPDRCRGANEPCRRPAHYLHDPGGDAWTSQRDLHDRDVCGRRGRLHVGRAHISSWWLECDSPDRRGDRPGVAAVADDGAAPHGVRVRHGVQGHEFEGDRQ